MTSKWAIGWGLSTSQWSFETFQAEVEKEEQVRKSVWWFEIERPRKGSQCTNSKQKYSSRFFRLNDTQLYMGILSTIITLLGTNISNISLEMAILKMIFPFQRWDMLVSWRVALKNPHHFTNHDCIRFMSPGDSLQTPPEIAGLIKGLLFTLVSLNKDLLKPYFWGGYVRGWLGWPARMVFCLLRISAHNQPATWRFDRYMYIAIRYAWCHVWLQHQTVCEAFNTLECPIKD